MLPLLMMLALDPGATTLRWEAPPPCPDRDALLAMIDATLGEVSDHERRAVDVHVRVRARDAEGFVLRLELDGGTRELQGDSCQELSEAAALLIAIAIDPRALDQRSEAPSEMPPPDPVESPSIEPTPNEPTPNEPTPNEPTLNEPTPNEPTLNEPTLLSSPPVALRERLRWLGRAEVGVGVGPLPGAAAVLGIATGVGGRGWRAELSAAYWTPRTRTSPINPAIGVRAQLWALGVHGCGEPRWHALSFPLCVGLSAGAVHARGQGELEPNTVVTRWAAIGLEPGLVWWVRPRLGLALRGEGHITLARPDLFTERSGTVFLGAPGGGSLRGGLELRLP